MMRIREIVFFGLIVFGLAACNINDPNITPTAEILISDTPTLEIAATASPSATASVTPTREIVDVPVIVASPLPTQADIVPDAEVTAAPTLGACEVTIQEGESLIGAISRVLCGNEPTQGLIDAVVAFNENIVNPDFVSPGLTFFVPLPSPTPIPEGASMTETAAARDGVSIVGGSRFVSGQEFGCYTIEEGDSVIGITDLYNTDLEVISQLNRSLNWQGCDFTNPSGGPNCNPGLRIGECVTVPLPTSTPIPTNTPSGRETATATPTQEAARVISPPEGALASQRITLEWVSVGILRRGEVYLIDVEDRTNNTSFAYITNNTQFTLPDSLIPSDGQSHSIAWRVRVARVNEDGTYTPVGGEGVWHNFQWQSR